MHPGGSVLQVQYLNLRRIGDPPQLFAAATRGNAGAVLVLASAYLFARQVEVCALAIKARLPVAFTPPPG